MNARDRAAAKIQQGQDQCVGVLLCAVGELLLRGLLQAVIRIKRIHFHG